MAKYDGYRLEVVYWGSNSVWHVCNVLHGCEADGERYSRMEEYAERERANGRKIRSIRIVGYRQVESKVAELKFAKED